MQNPSVFLDGVVSKNCKTPSAKCTLLGLLAWPVFLELQEVFGKMNTLVFLRRSGFFKLQEALGKMHTLGFSSTAWVFIKGASLLDAFSKTYKFMFFSN